MKHVSKWLLRAVTMAVPVVIAACYGMMYRYSRAGKVVDASTGTGIPGIQVTCLRGGLQDGLAMTDASGGFLLDYDACDELEAKDVDGTENGSYQTKKIPFPPGSDDITVSLETN